MAFYKRVLTPAERTWLYNGGSGRSYADLGAVSTGWYPNDYTYSTSIPHAVTSVTINQNQSTVNSYQYDANGNMTCRKELGITYLQTYNTENRISSIAKLASGDCAAPGNYATKWDFTYDGDGTRTATLITPYDANGQPQTASLTEYFFGGALETSNGSVKKYYSFAGQTIAMKDNGVLQYFLTDHLGSIVAVYNTSTGTLTQQRYLPFGAVRTIAGPITQTDLGYTGQRKLDSDMGGIMDYKARFYAPGLGRFLQPDTMIPTNDNPQSWNRYSYVQNRPIILNDPTGHCPTCLIGAIGGAIVLTAIVYLTHPDLSPQEYAKAAVVGATAGLLIWTGVGLGAGTAMAAAFVGAGAGALTAAGAYTVTAGKSYNGQEMAANASIGAVTGAATSLLGPEVLGTKLASSTAAIVGRTAINAVGAQVSQIVHNEYFDDRYPSYPPPSELVGGALVGGVGSGFGEVADSVVTTLTGSKAAGSIAYNLTKNFVINSQVNRFTNWIDECDDKGSC